MKLSTLLSLFWLGLATIRSANADQLVRVNIDRPDESELEQYDRTAGGGNDRALVADGSRELAGFGWRWRFRFILPYPIIIYPGRTVRFRFCFWNWGLYLYNFWYWNWWWYGWPYTGYYWYPWWWWWWRKVYYIPYFPLRDRERHLQLNVHGFTEGPATGNNVAVNEQGDFVGEAQFTPTQASFKTHGIDFKLSIPSDAPGPVTLTEITGAVDAEIIRFEEEHPEMFGDPHIQTWLGQYFEYNGECDLVFLRDKDFWNGLGVEIDVRTTHRYKYSYIEAAGIKIGNDVLEVDSFGEHALNGVEAVDLEETVMDLAGFPIYHTQPEEKKHIYDIVLNERSNITLTTYKDIVAVKLSGDHLFSENSTGILGSLDGDMLARDGKTLISDPNEFGQEWQVRDDEPMLFRTARAPQYPAKCQLPTGSNTEEGRRLRNPNKTVKVSEDEAEKVCSYLEGQQRMEDCKQDVLAFDDVDLAKAGIY